MRWLVAPLLLLAGCDGGGGGDRPPPAATAGWRIGPVIDGKNYSKACPLTFADTFTIGPCEPHYVTRPGKTITRLRYRLVGKVEGVKCDPATISLYFETGSVDWTRDGDRWWTGKVPLKEGEHEVVVTHWRSVMGMTAENNPTRFAQDRANAARVGFTFGDCTGLGHGVKGQAQFTVLEWDGN